MNQNSSFPHLAAWACELGISTIGRIFDDAVGRPETELLAGCFAFLAHPETVAVLDAWHLTPAFPENVLTLSDAVLLKAPPFSTMINAGRTVDQFPGAPTNTPIATMLCAQVPGHLQTPDKKDIACLRVYLLIKAMELASAGYEATTHISNASKQIRKTLEEATSSPDGLGWIRYVSPANDHFATYETSVQEASARLKRQIASEKEAFANPTAGYKFADSMEALSIGRPTRLIPLLGTHIIQPSIVESAFWEKAISEEGLDPQSIEDSFSLFDRANDKEEDENRVEAVVFKTPPSPAHSYRLGLGLHLQTQADRNYLPNAWNRLRQDEIDSLKLLMPQWIRSKQHSLLGAIVAMAFATQKSVEVVCSIAIAKTPADSTWVLDPEKGLLLRAPNRPSSRASASEVYPQGTGPASGWLRPLAEVHEILLEPTVRQVLQDAYAQRPAAKQLGGLWSESSTPQAMFNALCAEIPELARASQGLIPNTTEQLVFKATEDPTFTRILASSEDAVRPAAASYASWTLTQTNSVIATLSCAIEPQSPHQSELNGLGSELDPIDTLLQEEFERAAKKVESTLALSLDHPDAWIEAHNSITGYMVTAMLAGTGARPVNSVFEHRNDFDLERGRLFIDDKSFGLRENGRWGRIVPLPSVLVDLMNGLYIPYLMWLQAQLVLLESTSQDFKELADAISRILSGALNTTAPLFFLLKKTNKLRIVEVSERGLSKCALFAWPLPWNIFRHRIATRLRTLGCHEELVAAQMGHAEAGTDTYGNFSPRCWEKDNEDWLKLLDSCLALLRVQVIKFSPPSFSPNAQPSEFTRFISDASFGSKARRKDRELVRTRAHKAAEEFLKSEITARLNAKGGKGLKLDGEFPERLTDEQLSYLASTDAWTALSKSMLLTSKNTPRPNHIDWYEAFEAFRGRVSAGSYVRHRDRLLVRRSVVSHHVFSSDVLFAQRSLEALRFELSQAFTSGHASHRSLKLKGLLAALDLALNSSVSDASLLCKINISESSKFTLYSKGSNVFLALTLDRTERGGPPFGWICIPGRSVPCVADLMEAKGTEHKLEKLPDAIQGFTRAVERELRLAPRSVMDRTTLIRNVADLVDKANRLMLPGIIAGVRQGEVASWSLDQQAIARASVNKRPLPSPTVMLQPSSDTSSVAPTLVAVKLPAIKQPSSGINTDQELLTKVRSALTQFGLSVKDTASASPARAVAATAVRTALAEMGQTSSSSIQLLTAWIIRLLIAKGAAGTWLRASSIEKYLSLIATGFLDFGQEIDLLEADEEEIEEFYERVISRPVAVGQRGSQHDSEGRRLDESGVFGRLREFHQFIESEYGAESPDWSSLGTNLTSSMVSAELISPIEYEHALLAICPLNAPLDRDALMEGMLLLLGYRFGLRSAEAVSMARDDWVEVSKAVVVLVSGKFKTSKSKAGRRQIPLLGDLTEHERSIVDSWFEYWSSLNLPSTSAPMFPSPEDARKPARINERRQRVVEILRIATGSDRVTFHHARHSFACNVALRLIHPELLPDYPHLCTDWLWGDDSVQRQLLGNASVTRRAPWGVAVVLGHAHPTTSIGSYLHFCHEWANHLVIKKQPETFKFLGTRKLPGCLDLGDLATSKVAHPVPVPAFHNTQNAPRNPAAVLRYLELLSRSLKPDRAAWLCGFANSDADYLVECLEPLRSSPPKHGSALHKPQLPRILSVPTSARWSALKSMLNGCSLPRPAGKEAIWQIAEAKQILLWLPSHFEVMADMLSIMKWSSASLHFYKPMTGAFTAEKLAKERGWSLRATHGAGGTKHFQVEVGRYPASGGHTFFKVNDRIAVVPAPRIAPVDERAELILLWIALNLGT